MSSYLKGRIKQAKGWVIEGRDALPKIVYTKDTFVYAYHTDKGYFNGTIGQMSVITGKEVKHLSKLFTGKYKEVSGWRTTENKLSKATSNKQVFAYDQGTGKLLRTYESSTAASKDLGLRPAQMSEWLCLADPKLFNSIIYSRKASLSDKNIGVSR